MGVVSQVGAAQNQGLACYSSTFGERNDVEFQVCNSKHFCSKNINVFDGRNDCIDLWFIK
jgi:hypothetical protein